MRKRSRGHCVGRGSRLGVGSAGCIIDIGARLERGLVPRGVRGGSTLAISREPGVASSSAGVGSPGPRASDDPADTAVSIAESAVWPDRRVSGRGGHEHQPEDRTALLSQRSDRRPDPLVSLAARLASGALPHGRTPVRCRNAFSACGCTRGYAHSGIALVSGLNRSGTSV